MLLYFCCEGLSYLSYRKGCSLWQIQPVWKKAVNKIKIHLWWSEYIFIFMDHRQFSWRRNIFGISSIQFTLTLTLRSVAQSFWLSAGPWTVAHQAPPSMGFPSKSAGVVATAYSRGFSWPRGLTWVSGVSCIGRQVFYHSYHLRSLDINHKQVLKCLNFWFPLLRWMITRSFW